MNLKEICGVLLNAANLITFLLLNIIKNYPGFGPGQFFLVIKNILESQFINGAKTP